MINLLRQFFFLHKAISSFENKENARGNAPHLKKVECLMIVHLVIDIVIFFFQLYSFIYIKCSADSSISNFREYSKFLKVMCTFLLL